MCRWIKSYQSSPCGNGERRVRFLIERTPGNAWGDPCFRLGGDGGGEEREAGEERAGTILMAFR